MDVFEQDLKSNIHPLCMAWSAEIIPQMDKKFEIYMTYKQLIRVKLEERQISYLPGIRSQDIGCWWCWQRVHQLVCHITATRCFHLASTNAT